MPRYLDYCAGLVGQSFRISTGQPESRPIHHTHTQTYITGQFPRELPSMPKRRPTKRSRQLLLFLHLHLHARTEPKTTHTRRGGGGQNSFGPCGPNIEIPPFPLLDWIMCMCALLPCLGGPRARFGPRQPALLVSLFRLWYFFFGNPFSISNQPNISRLDSTAPLAMQHGGATFLPSPPLFLSRAWLRLLL